MAINPRKLRPTELIRLLVTEAGSSLTEEQLRRHRNRAGYTIGDARTVDLLRYAAWLTLEFFKPKSKPLTYEQRKTREAQRQAEMARAAQDIGEIPAVVNPERKAKAEDSFRKFCETYFPEVFYFAWSDDHLRVIDKIEKAVRTGGLFAMAMPRGSGKTVLCQTAVLWSALIGASPFVCLIAASAERARDLLENIKIWLETNPLLHADFPEVTYPIQCLERITNRQKGQKYHGEPTRIDWSSDRIVLPTIGKRQVRHALIDTNYWKTFVHARLAVAMGDPGCLSLFGRDDVAQKAHRLLADHLTAEYRVKTVARGQTVDEWKLRATRPDNHWLDCLVGCAVAASIQGAELFGTAHPQGNRRRIRLSELQAQRS